MAQPLSQEALDSALHPSKILQQTFAVERRGYNQAQVSAFLNAVSAALRDAQRRESEMRSRVGKAVRRAERAETELKAQQQLHSESQVDRQVGDEVAMVLQAAQSAAAQRLAEAADERAAIIDEAESQAAELRDAAGKVLGQRSAEAEQEAKKILARANARAKAITDAANVESQKIRNEAIARLTRARDEAELLVREAEEARYQILEDMDRRRHRARAQVERLKVGRDRLIKNYEVVGRTLEEVTTELRSSMKEAKASGDSAARMASSQPLASRDALIVEMEESGRITRRERTRSVMDSPALPSKTKRNRKTKKRRSRDDKPVAKPVAKMRPPVAPTLKASDSQSATVAKQPRPHETGIKNKTPQSDQPASEPTQPELTPLDPEIAALADKDLTIIDLGSEIETVVALGETDQQAEKETTKTTSTQKIEDKKQIAVEALGEETISAIAQAMKGNQETKTQTLEINAGSDASSTPGSATALLSPKQTPETDGLETTETTETTEIAETAETAKETETGTGLSLFAQLRATVSETPSDVMVAQSSEEQDAVQAVATSAADERKAELTPAELVAQAAPQIDELVTSLSSTVERKLRRVLADEQNVALSSVRKKDSEAGLVDSVGPSCGQLRKYLCSVTEEIEEIFAEGYRIGFSLKMDTEIELTEIHTPQSELPAGAIEEVIETELVEKIRARLAEIDTAIEKSAEQDGTEIDSRELLHDVRDFYRNVKSEVITKTARRLIRLCATSGVCAI